MALQTPFVTCAIFFLLWPFKHFSGAQLKSERSTCEEKWFLHEDSRNAMCLRAFTSVQEWSHADESCLSLGGRLAFITTPERNIAIQELLELGSTKIGSKFWVGQSTRRPEKFRPDDWSGPDDSDSEVLYDNFGDAILPEPCQRAYFFNDFDCCVLVRQIDGRWEATQDCERSHGYVCEKLPTCSDGLTGENCDVQCHCHGKPCSNGEPCQYGCQHGFTGHHCETERKRAEVVYYCVNSALDGRYALLRIKPYNVMYESIDAVNTNGQLQPWCNNTEITQDTEGAYTIKIPVSNNDTETGLICAGNKTGSSQFTWTVSIRERAGILLPFDRLVQFSCNFDNADNMRRRGSLKTANVLRPRGARDVEELHQEQQEQLLETLSESRENIVLEFVDPYTRSDLTEAVLGTNVQLRARLLKSKDVMADGVSLFDCEAFSQSKPHRIQLSDGQGCAVPGSPVYPWTRKNDTLVSPVFQLFSFPGLGLLHVSCSFEICFTPNDPKCNDRCKYMQYRRWNLVPQRKRRSADKQETLKTSIRVLPSVGHHKHSMDPSSEIKKGGSGCSSNSRTMTPQVQSDPLQYLNPIVCTLFLALFAVFLILYVFFIQSLKRSVEDIKREMESQRSRDKFFVT